MAKFFETSADIAELCQSKWEETGLAQMGIELKLLSVTKAKNVLKASKAGATINYLTKKDAFLIIYEEAFDRLSDEYKEKLLEGALSNISYDTEKDKLIIGGEPTITVPLGMYHKYEKLAVDMAELEQLTLQQIRDEEEEEKERKKAEKKEKKQKKF
jgi:nitric oxide synthase oxygenase domain/subunit